MNPFSNYAKAAPIDTAPRRTLIKSMHIYQQLEFSDCGYACIRMICRHYGWKVAPDYLREISDYNRLGLSIGEVRRTLQLLGFKCEAVKVRINECEFMPLPAILYWDKKHFVVIDRIDSSRGRYRILDPAEGKYTVREKEFAERFISENGFGIALVIEATPQVLKNKREVNRNEKRKGLCKLATKSLWSHKKLFFSILIFTLISLVADISLPFIFQRTIDEGISNKDIHLVWLLVLSQLFIFIGNFVSNSITELLLTKLGIKVGINMLNEYLSKLVRLPMTFYARKVNSDLIQKTEDHNRIRDFLLSVPNSLFFACVSILVFSTLLVIFSPLVFFIFMGFSLLSLLWTSVFLHYRRALDASIVSKTSENRNNLYELIEGIDEIKSNNAQHTRVRIWNELQEKINRLSIKSTFLKLYQAGGNTLLLRMRDIVITGICACMVIEGEMTIGVMMTVSYITGRLSLPFNSFFNSINSIQDASMSYKRIEEIHDMTVDERQLKKIAKWGELAMDNLSFKYPGAAEAYVLSNVDCVIPRGSITAIAGSSGSGKSTLLKLLMRFYSPQRGDIRISGTSIYDISEDDWSNNIAAVLQNGKIFSGTILSNIALSDETPDKDKAMQAARLACIDDFIGKLPLGLYSRIGRTGLELSGGQQQRILIARALYRNPEILILDEATSAVDAVTEARIMANIFGHFNGKTLIIAAHRLSTIRNADNILVLDKGKIIESGNHDTLLARNGLYAQLINRQI